MQNLSAKLSRIRRQGRHTVRTIFLLTGKWRFGLDIMNVGEDERWFRTDFDDGSRLLVDIPSS